MSLGFAQCLDPGKRIRFLPDTSVFLEAPSAGHWEMQEKNRVLQMHSWRVWRRGQKSKKQMKTRSQRTVALAWPQIREVC